MCLSGAFESNFIGQILKSSNLQSKNGGGGGEILELLIDWLPGHLRLSSLQRDFLWCNDQETYYMMRYYLLFGF